MDLTKIDIQQMPVGVVGLGLMGCSITTCLLISGHPVTGIAPLAADMGHAEERVRAHLTKAIEEGLADKNIDDYIRRLTITDDYSRLADCKITIESTLEDIDIKKAVFEKIEAAVSPTAIIGSNTSAIPISILQQHVRRPERFFGLHWTEPAYTTRFLEIICGDLSDKETAKYLYELAHYWDKEPTLALKDIRGFITNRLMYAMYREAFNLVEGGYASVEDVDRACRNNAGYWMTLVGVFRWMDLTGLPAYHAVMKDLLPTLSNKTEIPKLIDDLVKDGAKGVANAKGFYDYTPEEAKLWQETYREFSYDIMRIAKKYPADVVKKKLAALSTSKG
ncbi:MAG: 3-hydroxyacyl-CoA dehydrogenase family protein [Chitinophagaceae bacterium]|nr:3-hydroxyacyl-CoA dehydrogenase family protein [Chitinophagaceae bacterium]